MYPRGFSGPWQVALTVGVTPFPGSAGPKTKSLEFISAGLCSMSVTSVYTMAAAA